MSLLSKLRPTTSSIQKEYVEKRQRVIYANDPKKTEAVKVAIEKLMAANSYAGDWYDVYTKINRGLQDSELTINFDAGSWFLNENLYPSYSQMYERATDANGKMALRNGSSGNKAVTRAAADDLVTLPEEWAFAHRFSQRRRLYDAFNATGATNQSMRGKWGEGNPDTANMTPKLQGSEATGYSSKNKDFKPKGKQVFAALNYGSRPHGSNVYYGFSHLILKPALKFNAIYYPGDTFFVAGFGSGTKSQAAYYTLGAMMQFAGGILRNDLWDSFVKRASLADTKSGDQLIEAHLFTTIKMNRDVEALVLSRTPKDFAGAEDWTPHWDTIAKNARTWCTRNNVRLIRANS